MSSQASAGGGSSGLNGAGGGGAGAGGGSERVPKGALEADATDGSALLRSHTTPHSVKVVAMILKSMGLKFEPRVVDQLLEFVHRYVADVLQSAQVYKAHAKKPVMDMEDLRLAIQAKVNHSFSQPPPRELLLEVAQQCNARTLPMIPKKFGVLLPPREYCTLDANFDLDVREDTLFARVEELDVTATTAMDEGDAEEAAGKQEASESSTSGRTTTGGSVHNPSTSKATQISVVLRQPQ